MTGEQFVKLCYEEKKTILAEYFNPNSSSVVGKKISAITEQGISKDDLYDLLNLVTSLDKGTQPFVVCDG